MSRALDRIGFWLLAVAVVVAVAFMETFDHDPYQGE